MIYLTRHDPSPTYMLIDKICDIDAHYVQALADSKIRKKTFQHQFLDLDKAVGTVEEVARRK